MCQLRDLGALPARAPRALPGASLQGFSAASWAKAAARLVEELEQGNSGRGAHAQARAQFSAGEAFPQCPRAAAPGSMERNVTLPGWVAAQSGSSSGCSSLQGASGKKRKLPGNFLDLQHASAGGFNLRHTMNVPAGDDEGLAASPKRRRVEGVLRTLLGEIDEQLTSTAREGARTTQPGRPAVGHCSPRVLTVAAMSLLQQLEGERPRPQPGAAAPALEAPQGRGVLGHAAHTAGVGSLVQLPASSSSALTDSMGSALQQSLSKSRHLSKPCLREAATSPAACSAISSVSDSSRACESTKIGETVQSIKPKWPVLFGVELIPQKSD